MLAVTPLTFYASWALLRHQSSTGPMALWLRFALGAAFALPGLIIAGMVDSWFGSSFRLIPLFFRLTVLGHFVPAFLSVATAFTVEFTSGLFSHLGEHDDGDPLPIMASVAGFGSIFLVGEFIGDRSYPDPVNMLIVPTLRVSVFMGIVVAWQRRFHPFFVIAIATITILYGGLVSYLYVVGFQSLSGGLTAAAAVLALFGLFRIRHMV